MKSMLGVLILGLSLQIQAADRLGNYAIWGPGQKSCYRYLKERTAAEDAPYKSYVMGYLTAYNAVTPETYSISRDMNLDEILVWLDDYCDVNQMGGIEAAMLEFISAHHEKRFRTPPSAIGR